MSEEMEDAPRDEEYSDATVEELYMKALKHSEPHAPDYPGAGREYLRRYREHQRQQGTKQNE
jgi:hypothetical protein